MKKYLAVLLLISSQASAQKGKVILAIFAHADDENIVAPVLAKYSAEGAAVYLAVATDGRYGVTDFAHIPAGDSLAHVRAREIKCAAAELGIHPPILMGFPDALRSDERKTQAVLDSIKDIIIQLFTELKPDVVITWGASGWTGHPDHRLIGAAVTEVFSSKQWGKPARLYYPEIATGYLPPENVSYATVDSAYLPVRIALSAADLAIAKKELHCHQSQYTYDYAESKQKRIWNTPGATAFFQPFIPVSGIQNTLFPPSLLPIKKAK